MAIANLTIYYTSKNISPEYNNNKFEILTPSGMILSIYLIVLLLLQTFKVNLSLSLKNMKL